MKRTYKALAEKYLNDHCTPEEAEQVLEWFDTPEGRAYLEEQIDADIRRALLEGDEHLWGRERVRDTDSKKMLQNIRQRSDVVTAESGRRHEFQTTLLRVAAVALVVITVGLIYHLIHEPPAGEVAEQVEPARYTTADGQQREVVFEDGTTIRMNSNTEIQIVSGGVSGGREIELAGEAYFDVVRNPERPFTIYTNEAVIEVLGTAFNVKAPDGGREVQLAVVEGRVRFGTRAGEPQGRQKEVAGGEFAWLDLERNRIGVEEYGVENYLAWMRGRLVFEGLSLERVCVQLERLYGVRCEFSDEALKSLRLTADFSPDTLEKTLSVISLSLGIGYERTDDGVVWKKGESGISTKEKL